MKYFSLQDIQKTFGTHSVLRGIDLCLQPGRCYLLTGANGAGKSTLLRICAGLEKPERCHVDVGTGLTSWNRCRKILRSHTVYLHQQPYMFDGSVIHNLAYALRQHKDKKAQKKHIRMALQWAGLNDSIAHSCARTLSGGECQRVALARAWLRSPKVMLLDEPTNNLDEDARQRTIAMLMSLKTQGITLLIASHESDYFDGIADEILVLVDGTLASKPVTPSFDTNIISHAKIMGLA